MKKGEKLRILEEMLLIRMFEERVKALLDEGEITGELQDPTSEEAIVVAVRNALSKEDTVIGSHFQYGHESVKSKEISEWMAKLGGRISGFYDREKGALQITAMDLAGGEASPSNLMEEKNSKVVVVCFRGEQSNEKVMMNALHMATIWKLPVVFILKQDEETEKWDHIKMERTVVDGMDVHAVYQEAKKAVKRARDGEGPTLIGCKIFCGDECSSPVGKKDPVQHFKSVLLDERTPKVVIDVIEKKVEETVKLGIQILKEKAYPTWEDAYKNAYTRMFERLPLKG